MTSNEHPYTHETHDDYDNDGHDPFDDDCDRAECWQCSGDGYVIIGEEVPARDIDLGDEGKLRECPCCGGTGLASDETYW